MSALAALFEMFNGIAGFGEYSAAFHLSPA
jgi:hypothetical protein